MSDRHEENVRAAALELYRACTQWLAVWDREPDREFSAAVIENMRKAVAKAEGR